MQANKDLRKLLHEDEAAPQGDASVLSMFDFTNNPSHESNKKGFEALARFIKQNMSEYTSADRKQMITRW